MTSLTVHPELELESTESRFLEPVGLDSQEEFQAANEVKCLPPADETLSERRGYQVAWRGGPCTPRPEPKDLSLLQLPSWEGKTRHCFSCDSLNFKLRRNRDSPLILGAVRWLERETDGGAGC